MKLNKLFRPTINCYKLFENREKLINILDNLTKKLGTPATIIGGSALPRYGYNRTTEDIDIITTMQDAKKIGDELYKHKSFTFIGHSKFKHISGMSINFCPEGVLSGRYKFPAPESTNPGLHYASLPLLLSLKIKAKRLKDRGDYAELIKRNNLSQEYIKDNVLRYLNVMDKKWAIALWKEAQKEY